MTRRSVRVTLVCLGVLLTAALSYRVLVDERRLTSDRDQLTSIDASISDVLRTLSDVRGALHAYVAPGQRSAIWEARSAALFDKLRQQLIALDAAADSSGRSLSDSLDNLDQLTAAEKRVQHYLDFSQPLLAGDVIFTEIRDLVDATGQQVTTVRDAVQQEVNGRIEQTRREQAMVVGAGAIVWLGLALLLAVFPATERREPTTSVAPGSHTLGESFDLSLTPRAVTSSVQESPTATFVDEAAPVENPEIVRWEQVSKICKELSSVKDLALLPVPLAHACEALGAKDAILWVASADGATLTPQASHGFDPRLLARIGAIARDSANLTAAALRDGQPHKSSATSSAPGALAVALRGPSGPVGVLSVELQEHSDMAEAVDLATMFAAQICPLVIQTQAAAAEIPQRRQA